MDNTIVIAIILVIGFLSLITYSHYKSKNAKNIKKSENIKLLSPKSINQFTKDGLVLVDFWAASYEPCKTQLPILNSIADSQGDKLSVAKINLEQYRQVASKYKIKSLPTLILYKDGVEVKRILGVKSKKDILKEVAQYA